MDVARVRAENPSPMTLDGTNTWVVGRDPCWVIDPGPVLEEHLDAVATEVARRGGAAGILLTHDHADHSEAVPALADRLAVALVAPSDGPFEVIPTPGHSADHVAYLVGDGAVCVGDAVLGTGSVFVAAEPGALVAYLDALSALRARAGLTVLLPGHGPPVDEPYDKLDEYLAHRRDRERRLLAALDAGVRDADGLLDAAWDDVSGVLRPVAGITLRSHLHKLAEEDRLPAGVHWPQLPAWASQIH